jgi:DNA polymerase-3 subunit delta
MKLGVETLGDRRVALISGEESVLRRSALAQLLALAGVTADDFDVESVVGDERSISDWIASASTVPFLASRRVVVVRHLLRAGEPDGELLAQVPATGLLILVCDDEGGDDARQRRLQTVRGQWERATAKAGGLVVKAEVDPKKAASLLREEAERLGARLTPGAADVLLQVVGGRYSRACEEIDKLALYVGEGGEIREADVHAAVRPSMDWNVFRLLDAVIEGQGGEAIRQLRILIGGESKAEEAAYRSIFPILGKQFRLIWQARQLVEAGATPDRPGAVAAHLPSRPNLLDEPSWRQGLAIKAARRLGFVQLQRCLQALSDADARLKGQLPAFSPMETLDRLVIGLVETVRDRS